MGVANWRWVNEHGAQFQLTDDELIGGLSSEAIPSYALVWRAGWAEWLPAMHVAELSWALPAGAADQPLKPKSGATHAVPIPPLERYSELRRQAESRRQRSDPPYSSFLPNTSPPTSVGMRGAREHDDDWEPLTQIHDPESSRRMSELAREAGFEDGDEVTHMMSEPISPVPRSVTGPFVSPSSHGPNVSTSAPQSTRARPPAFSRSGSLPPPDPNWRQRTGEHPAVAPPPPSTQTAAIHIPKAPSTPAGMNALGAGGGAGGPYGSHYPAPQRGRGVLVLGGMACGLAAAVVTLFFRGGFAEGARERVQALLFRRAEPTLVTSSTSAPAPTAVPSAAPIASVVAPRPTACRLAEAPRELAPWAHGTIPIELARTKEPSKIAIGYAQAPHYAMGISVDLEDLAVERIHREYRKEQIFSVAPILAYGKLGFSAERQGERLAFALTVDAKPPFAFGRSQAGLAVLHQGAETQLAWPLSGAQEAGLPAIVKATDGFAVAIRIGGPKGTVALGYLDGRGKPSSELFESAPDKERISLRPSLVVRGDDLVLAYAAVPRGSQGLRQLWLARGRVGAAPGAARAVDMSEEDSAAEVSHVQLASAGPREYIAQWTAGLDAQQRVRVQMLGSELEPIGKPVTLSSDVGYSYGGAVWSDGKRIFSAYVQNNDGEDQLWGATLRCD